MKHSCLGSVVSPNNVEGNPFPSHQENNWCCHGDDDFNIRTTEALGLVLGIKTRVLP